MAFDGDSGFVEALDKVGEEGEREGGREDERDEGKRKEEEVEEGKGEVGVEESVGS